MKLIDRFEPLGLGFGIGGVLLTLKDTKRTTKIRSEYDKFWDKQMRGFKQTWDFNADGGLKEIWQKGKEIRLITYVYGHVRIYSLTEKELKEELETEQDDSWKNWERCK